MNKKFLLSVSLISFYSANMPSLLAKTTPLTSVKSLESASMDLLEANFKTLEDIKENVKSELVEVLLTKLLELQKNDKKKKKKHEFTQARDTSSGFAKSEGSTQRILEITSPSNPALTMEIDTPALAANSDVEGSVQFINEESSELIPTQSFVRGDHSYVESSTLTPTSAPHLMPEMHASVSSTDAKEAPTPTIDFSGFSIKQDPLGNFVSINDKILLTQKGLVQLKKQILTQKKIVQKLKWHVKSLEKEFTSHSISEEEFLSAQIELHRAEKLLAHMNTSRVEQERFLDEHKDLVALLEKLPTNHSGAKQLTTASSGIAQDFFKLFENTLPTNNLMGPSSWKEQKEIQTAFQRHFGLDIKMDSSTILAIHKMHKKLHAQNSGQTLAATTYAAGTLLLSDMLDSFSGNREVQQKIAKILPLPNKYASKTELVADYGRRLSDYPTIFGDEPITMINRHFEHVTSTSSKQAKQIHAFMSKLLDVSLRFSRGLDGLGAFFNRHDQKFDEDKFFDSVAAPLAGIAGVFGIKSVQDSLKEGFTGLTITDLSSLDTLQIIKETIVKSIVGANKAEMLHNIEQFLMNGVINSPRALADIKDAFKSVNDTPADLSEALLLMMEDQSDAGGFLIPLYTALEEIDPIIAIAHDRLDGRRSAGAKLMKILQENHIQKLGVAGAPGQSLEQTIMLAVNDLIRSEFNSLSVQHRAKSTAVSALVKDLFSHGLFEGIALTEQERKNIKAHVEDIISLQALTSHLGAKELHERETALNTPEIKAIAQKVATLVKSDCFSDPAFDLPQALHGTKPVLGSAKNTKKEIEASYNELNLALGEEIKALNRVGARFENLSETETRELIERCVGRVPALAQNKSASLEDIVDLIIARVKTTKDTLIKSGSSKRQLVKAHVILANDWKNTLALLGATEHDQLLNLGGLDQNQMLKLYNYLVDLGEEVVTFDDTIKSKLTRLITLAKEVQDPGILACTFEDFEAAALKDQAQRRLVLVVKGQHIETDLQPFDIKLASTLAWKNRDSLTKAKNASLANTDLLRDVDNNEALSAMKNILAHLTNETRVLLGLIPTDGPDEVEHKIQLALKKQHDAITLEAEQKTTHNQGKKVGVLGGKDLTPSNGDLTKPYNSKETTAESIRMAQEDKFDEAISTLNDVLKQKNLHLNDQAIKGLLLLLSHNKDITQEATLKECGDKIADVLMKNFYTAFDNSDNKKDALAFIKKSVVPHTDAMSVAQQEIMDIYCKHIYNVAEKLFAEKLVKGQAFNAATFFKEVEEREVALAMKHLLPNALGLSENNIEQALVKTLSLATYTQQEREEIVKQARRILIARAITYAPKLPVEEVIHGAVNDAIQQTIDAPHRILVARAQNKQVIMDETKVDFDHIVRRSSATLQKLMFTKILGMDERSVALQNHLNCFSSLEDVSASFLLSGLVSLVDDLKDDLFGSSQVTESARQKTKRALIKRFARIEEKLLADSIVHDALKKDTIALRIDFRNTLSSRLGSQDSKIQQKALVSMDDQALQSLYNALIADTEDQVVFVDSQLIAHRLLRIITAAQTGKPSTSIDYTFHDFMDYIMRATDDESVDIALSDTKSLVEKEALLDLDRLVVGKLSWEKKLQEHDKDKKSDMKKLQEAQKESVSEDLKDELIRKAAKKDSKDAGE